MEGTNYPSTRAAEAGNPQYSMASQLILVGEIQDNVLILPKKRKDHYSNYLAKLFKLYFFSDKGMYLTGYLKKTIASNTDSGFYMVPKTSRLEDFQNLGDFQEKI